MPYGGLDVSVLVCVLPIDEIRPATQEQALAYLPARGHNIGICLCVISDSVATVVLGRVEGERYHAGRTPQRRP